VGRVFVSVTKERALYQKSYARVPVSCISVGLGPIYWI
jgi:hypothetical protein